MSRKVQRMDDAKRLEIWPDGAVASLPNGCTLFRKYVPEVGCWEYASDEVGGGVFVWSEALVDAETLLVAVIESKRQRAMEQALLDGWTPDPVQ